MSIQHKYTEQREKPREKGFNISVNKIALKRCLTSLLSISSPNCKQLESPCTFGWALGLEMLSALLTDSPNSFTSLDPALSSISFPFRVCKGAWSCPALSCETTGTELQFGLLIRLLFIYRTAAVGHVCVG